MGKKAPHTPALLKQNPATKAPKLASPQKAPTKRAMIYDDLRRKRTAILISKIVTKHNNSIIKEYEQCESYHMRIQKILIILTNILIINIIIL